MGLRALREHIRGEFVGLELDWVPIIIATDPPSVVSSGDCHVGVAELFVTLPPQIGPARM